MNQENHEIVRLVVTSTITVNIQYTKNVDMRKAAQKWFSAFFCVRFPLFAHAAHWERKKSGHLPKAEVCF
jgi:hypothetical protein